jgi:hypothetical protein
MKKFSYLFLMLLCACAKDVPNVQHPRYDGLWNVGVVISKVYTLEKGDTMFSRNDTTIFGPGTASLDFRLDGRGGGSVISLWNGKTDSLTYEAVAPEYFRLDSTLCEVKGVADSAFTFNTLIFDNKAIPDRIQVTQDYFLLYK